MQRARKQVKILLTGGHAGSTAYAFIQELRSVRKTKWEISWIGASLAMEGSRVPTYEKVVFPKIGVKYYPIFTGRLQRTFTFWTIVSLLKIPLGFLHGIILVSKLKPEITLSFGGYSSFPVVFASKLLGIPVIIHEQTQEVGRANKYSGIFADKIALARYESRKYFDRRRCVVVGNPISKEVKSVKPKNKMNHPPVVLVTGGSRGSVAINNLINNSLIEILKDFKLIHQVGFLQYGEFKEKKKALPKSLRMRYELFPFKEPWEWYKYLKKSDIIISRSGANTVSELLIIKRPTILIPLSISFLDEQKRNAQMAKKFGIARIINQNKATKTLLIKELSNIKNNYSTIVAEVAHKKSPDENSSKKLVELVLQELNK